MPLWNFIRDIFLGKNSDEPRNKGFFDDQDRANRDSFRNPIWQNDEDDDDMEDFRHSRGGVHFHIFNDPLEITRQFESQIDNLMKSFFGFHHEENMFSPALPPPQEGNLREEMLKRNSDDFSEVTPKEDINLDGKVTPDNFSNIWNTYNEPNRFKSTTVFMTRKEFIHKPDGTIEQKQIIKDNEGNEETTISRQIGDKLHTITTKKDKNGVETKTEELINIDESELKGNKWLLPNDNSSNSPNISWSYFPWKQFFKPDPKL
nr:uncharacterized protein LOC117228770 isoform X1 [Megalopta genalis]